MCGFTSRSATGSFSPTPRSTGSIRQSPSRSSTIAASSSRAGKCWGDRARSTACCTSAANMKTLITGVSSAIPAGASRTCCRISAAPRTRSAARTRCMAQAGRSRSLTCANRIHSVRPSSRLPNRRASRAMMISMDRRRKARGISSSPPAGVAAARRPSVTCAEHAGGRISLSCPMRWRGASCSMAVEPSESSIPKAGPRVSLTPAARSYSPAAHSIRRSCYSSQASGRRTCSNRTGSRSSPTYPGLGQICRTTCRSGCSIDAPSRSP